MVAGCLDTIDAMLGLQNQGILKGNLKVTLVLQIYLQKPIQNLIQQRLEYITQMLE